MDYTANNIIARRPEWGKPVSDSQQVEQEKGDNP
jgi:hypothetical protein